MAKMRSENTEYAKTRNDAIRTGVRANASADVDQKSEDFRQFLADRQKAQRDEPEKDKALRNSMKETGYDYSTFSENNDPIDRLSRSPTSDSEGMMKYRKGGMVKKKATKMAGGGAVRGAGCATKGKGKMRVY